MATTLNKVVLKEFKDTNFKSFSDGQITINFPNEENLTQVDVVLTPTGGLYEGGTFVFRVGLPSNYPEAVASISCKTKIFHPNIDFSGYICFNILSDEWNTDVRLVDYAHALLWLLYQPNLSSRLNGSCPSDEAEFAALVKQSLQGKVVAGVVFPQMIPAPPEPIREEPRFTVAQRVAMFNAPHPPTPPPPNFRMRIPTTNAPVQPAVAAPLPLAVIDTSAPLPPPLPPSDFRMRLPTTPVPTPIAPAMATVSLPLQPLPAPQDEDEDEDEEKEKEEEVEMPRPLPVLRRSGDEIVLGLAQAAWRPPTPGLQTKEGISQEKQSKRGRRNGHKHRRRNGASKMPQRRQAAAY